MSDKGKKQTLQAYQSYNTKIILNQRKKIIKEVSKKY